MKSEHAQITAALGLPATATAGEVNRTIIARSRQRSAARVAARQRAAAERVTTREQAAVAATKASIARARASLPGTRSADDLRGTLGAATPALAAPSPRPAPKTAPAAARPGGLERARAALLGGTARKP